MSDRDRLVELLKEADDATEVHDCDYPTYEKAMQAFYTSIADYLLANGVIAPRGGMAMSSGYYSPEVIKKLKAETKDWKRDYFYGNLCPECQAKLAELKGK